MAEDIIRAEQELGSERTKAVITLVVTTIVTIANMYGFAADAEAWVNVALSILDAALMGYMWWKNQNVTLEAVRGQHVIDDLKAERKAS